MTASDEVSALSWGPFRPDLDAQGRIREPILAVAALAGLLVAALGLVHMFL